MVKSPSRPSVLTWQRLTTLAVAFLLVPSLVAGSCTRSTDQPEQPQIPNLSTTVHTETVNSVKEVDHAAARYINQLGGSVDDRSNALLQLYPMMGYPVIDDNGTRVITAGYSGEGFAAYWWEVWYHAASPHAGGLSVADIADMLADAAVNPSTVPEFARSGIRKSMLNDLSEAGSSSDLRTRALGAAVRSAARVHGKGQFGDPDLDPSQVFVSSDVALLVLRAGAADLTFSASHQITSQGSLSNGPATDKGDIEESRPCQFNATESGVIRIAEEVIARGFRGQHLIPAPWGPEGALGWKVKLPGLQQVLEQLGDRTKSLLGKLGVAQLVLDLLKLLVQLFSLDVEIIPDKSPLVRTKEVGSAGERTHLTAKLTYNLGSKAFVNCFRLVFANMGMKFSVPSDGPLYDADVTFVGLNGFGPAFLSRGSGEKLVELWDHPGGTYHAPTGRDGTVRIGVQGTPQKKPLSSPISVRKSYGMMLDIQLRRANVFNDFWDAFNTAVKGTPYQSAADFMINIMKRSRWGSGAFDFELTDWTSMPSFVIDEYREEVRATLANSEGTGNHDEVSRSVGRGPTSSMDCHPLRSPECWLFLKVHTVSTYSGALSCGEVYPPHEIDNGEQHLATLAYDPTLKAINWSYSTSLLVGSYATGSCIADGAVQNPNLVATINIGDLMSGRQVSVVWKGGGNTLGVAGGSMGYKVDVTAIIRRVNGDGTPYAE
ncbi:hypothetical protein ACWGE0_00255 [Lentzea sp. NPDC054927]